MRGKVRIFGGSLPVWVLAAALIAATAGTATGVVLAGNVDGRVAATASQAIKIGDGAGTTVSGADEGLVFVEDDGTGFHAAAEINTGDDYEVELSVSNLSDDELTGELTLTAPDGITLDVEKAGAITDDILQSGPSTWKFKLPVNDADATTDMKITVALADDTPPGFYSIDGTIEQVRK